MDNFSKKYDRDQFIKFIKDKSNFKSFNKDLKIGNNKLFKSIQQIGLIELDENIPVYEVEHNSKNDPRIELTRNFFSILSANSIRSSIVIFFL